MKLKIIKILSVIFQQISTCLVRLKIMKPKVIIYVDGGICSQMHMFLEGAYYAKAGMKVYYDLRWYERTKDVLVGVNSRTFELQQMWPKLRLSQLSNRCNWFYYMFFKADRTKGDFIPERQSLTRSVYLHNYWNLPEDCEELFNMYFNLQNAAKVSYRPDALGNRVCGVHVRRGDLAKGDNPVYGGVTEGYFLRAIEYVKTRFPDIKFLFFSDEPDWVEQNICRQIDAKYEIIKGNKAWEDLRLLASCNPIIASQGSFGKVAAKLNSEAMLIQCDNSYANRIRKNTYFIK